MKKWIYIGAAVGLLAWWIQSRTTGTGNAGWYEGGHSGPHGAR